MRSVTDQQFQRDQQRAGELWSEFLFITDTPFLPTNYYLYDGGKRFFVSRLTGNVFRGSVFGRGLHRAIEMSHIHFQPYSHKEHYHVIQKLLHTLSAGAH